MQHRIVIISTVILFCIGLSGLQAQTVKDIEGNVYKTVIIGKQVWMAVNLKTTKYNDGKKIPLVTDNTEWTDVSTPEYCWYNNDIANKEVYGALYNWYTVNTNKVCPKGWHVPTGGKLKETGTTHWKKPNTGATKSSGFTARAGGGRHEDGKFYDLGSKGYWWSSTEEGEANAWCFELQYAIRSINRLGSKKPSGLSIRCLRNK
jgi:uncharacterized protein (TIGR02145 family)